MEEEGEKVMVMDQEMGKGKKSGMRKWEREVKERRDVRAKGRAK